MIKSQVPLLIHAGHSASLTHSGKQAVTNNVLHYLITGRITDHFNPALSAIHLNDWPTCGGWDLKQTRCEVGGVEYCEERPRFDDIGQ